MPEDILKELLKEKGVELVHTPEKLIQLMQTKLQHHKREFYILKSCLDDGIVKELIDSSHYIPVEILFSKMAEKLQNQRAMNALAAKWGIETWATALQLIPLKPSTPNLSKNNKNNGLDLDNPFIAPFNANAHEKIKKAIELAIEDGILTSNEKQTLSDFCQLLNIPMAQVQAIIKEIKAQS